MDTDKPKLDFIPTESFAVLLGTSTYQAGYPNIPGVEGNLRELNKRLVDPRLFGLGKTNVIPILNDADLINVRRTIAETARKAKSLFLLYYSGHGATRADTLFLTLPPTTPKDAEQSGLSWSDIRQSVQESPANTKLIVLDCCYSGRALKGILSDPEEWLDQQLKTDERGQEIDPTGFVALASSPATSVSYGLDDKDNTEFTGHLLSILDAGIPGAGPFLSVEQIFASLDKAILRTRRDDSSIRLPKPQLVASGYAAKAGLVRNRQADPTAIAAAYESQLQSLRAELEKVRTQNLELRETLADAAGRPGAASESPELTHLAEWSAAATEVRSRAAELVETRELDRLSTDWLYELRKTLREMDLLSGEFSGMADQATTTLADRRLMSELSLRQDVLTALLERYRRFEETEGVVPSSRFVEGPRSFLLSLAYFSLVLSIIALLMWFVNDSPLGNNVALGLGVVATGGWLVCGYGGLMYYERLRVERERLRVESLRPVDETD